MRISDLGPFPYLQNSEVVVFKEGEANDWDQKKLQAECVIVTVKRFPKFPIDHVYCDIGAEEENHLKGETQKWMKSFPSLFAGLWSHPELGSTKLKGLTLCPKAEEAKSVRRALGSVAQHLKIMAVLLVAPWF